MDILMASSELAPIAKDGGLADAVSALSKTLCQFDHHVTVAIPRYGCLERSGLMLARRLTSIRLDVGAEVVEATLFDGRLGSGVELLVIDIEGLYDRDGLYGVGGVDFEDNAARFGLWCRALAQVVAKREQEGRPFDVLHAHDWPSALLPFLLREAPIRTILTVHSAVQQGQFPKDAVDHIGLSWEDFHPAGLEFYDQLNLLKAGVLAADQVAAVSPTFAADLQTHDGGAGLDGVFRARSAELVGILNGIDYAVWSPSTDPYLTARFDAEDVRNKSRCKAALRHELALAVDPERPLVVSVGRVAHERGSDLVAGAIEPIVRAGAQVIVGGAGPPEIVSQLERAARRDADDVRYLASVDEAATHRLGAAADLVLVPSRFEPCGARQLHAQRYGALPVAHAVGGLRDSIVDCDGRLETGTGFLFEQPTVEALVGAVQRALAAMRTERWAALRRRVMRLDLSWERSARRYAKLYQPSPTAG